MHLFNIGFSLSSLLILKKMSCITHLCKITSDLSFLSLISLLQLPGFISFSGETECLLLLSPDYLSKHLPMVFSHLQRILPIYI